MKCTNSEMKKLISLYQFGLLPDDQKDSAEAHLLECEACLKELYQMDPALELLDEKFELFLDALKPQKNEGSRLRRIFNRIKIRLHSFMAIWQRHRIIGIAAPAAVVVAVILYLQISIPKQYADLAIVEKSPYEALYFKSPETLSPNQKIFKTALELYEKNQYSDAIMQLKNLIIEEPDNAYAHFFLGVSLLLLDDIGASQQQLIKALQFSRHQEDDLLREKCYWYIGNISLKNNREKDAIWIFQKIVSMNGSFQAKAEDQISKVIKLKKRIED